MYFQGSVALYTGNFGMGVLKVTRKYSGPHYTCNRLIHEFIGYFDEAV